MGFLFGQAPYCGSPPTPASLWWRWRLDPLVIAILFFLLLAYLIGAAKLGRRARAPSAARRGAFIAGWAVGALSLVSPLCPLSVALFAARDAQHMLICLVSAPLVMAGRPLTCLAAFAGRPQALPAAGHSGARALWAAGAFAVLLWFWHAPGPYDATFHSPLIYWAMHLSLFASACVLWSGFVDGGFARPIESIGAAIFSSVQMGLLGALLTFAPRPLYSPYAHTAKLWGLTPLADQQLGGAIMWAPGCAVFLALSMIGLSLLIGRPAGSGLAKSAPLASR